MVITLSPQYAAKEALELSAKLKKDKALFKELFVDQLGVKDIDESCKYVDILAHCFRDRPEEVALLLIPLAAKLETDFNENVLVSFAYRESDHEAETRFHEAAQGNVLPNHEAKKGRLESNRQKKGPVFHGNRSQTKSFGLHQQAQKEKRK
jgi:hypothetical protein